jgi:23S rRNA pseudouridine1911/1915/1917 synthase
LGEESETIYKGGLPCRISQDDAGVRLDNFLLRVFVGKSRSCISNAVKSGGILLNGNRVKAGYSLRAGDEVSGGIAVEKITAEPEQTDLDIVFEDKFLMVINKPRGMAVHPGAGRKNGTLLNFLLGRNSAKRFGGTEAVHGELTRAGIVHRIDKNTAGLLIVAKTAEAQSKLGEMFARHEVKRTYLGVAEGVIKNNVTIDKSVIRHPKHRTLFTAADIGGRRAVTHLTVAEQYKKYTLCRFELETGRTHQIRVHCKFINHPLVGDPEYNPNGTIKSAVGQALDAVKLEFIHPMTQKNVKIEIPPSKQLTDIINKCKHIM